MRQKDEGISNNFQMQTIHQSSCVWRSKTRQCYIQQPANQLFCKYLPRRSLAHQEHNDVDYVNEIKDLKFPHTFKNHLNTIRKRCTLLFKSDNIINDFYFKCFSIELSI